MKSLKALITKKYLMKFIKRLAIEIQNIFINLVYQKYQVDFTYNTTKTYRKIQKSLTPKIKDLKAWTASRLTFSKFNQST